MGMRDGDSSKDDALGDSERYVESHEKPDDDEGTEVRWTLTC